MYPYWQSLEWLPSFEILCHSTFLDPVLFTLLLFYWGVSEGQWRQENNKLKASDAMENKKLKASDAMKK